MAHLQTRRFGKPELMDIFLKGGVTGKFQVQPQVWGLHGLTLVFTSPSAKTVTFSAPNSAPLTPGEIIQQISNTLNDPAETTEGGTALSGITMAGETLTLYLDEKSDPVSVLFGTESGEAPILAVLNAALNPLGVTATAGGAGGVVLTTDDAGHSKSIRVAATGGGQAALDMTVETKTGVTNVAARFHDGLLTLVEGAPASGVALDGAISTAAQYFGFSDKAVAGTVYAGPDGSAPRFINFAPSGQMDGIIVMTEEA
jgi:hypothetical protein